MPASKMGSSIWIEGSPNTLASITADIGDNTWIEEAPAGTWTIKDKEISIVNGGVLTIGDSGDYSVAEKVIMQTTTNNYCNITVYLGGELQMFGDVEIDATTQPGVKYNTWTFNGKFYVRGAGSFIPTLRHIYKIARLYNSLAPTHDRNHDVMDIDHLKVLNPYSSSYGGFIFDSYMYYLADKDVEKWKNIEFGEAGDLASNLMSTFSLYSVADDYSKAIIEDCKFSYAKYPISLSICPIHFKNCLFSNITVRPNLIQMSSYVSQRTQAKDLAAQEMDIQKYAFYEGCEFTDALNDCFLVRYGANLLLKDNTIKGTDGVELSTMGKAYIWTGNTFNCTNDVRLADDHSFAFYVHALDLTVKSKETGNPLADAMVYIRQKDGKEKWLFKTDANGKPVNMAALDGKVILIHKEQTDNVPNYDLWSDAGNSTYHEIWIWKEGYEPHKLTYEMSADRTVTVELEDALVVGEVKDGVPFGLALTGTLAAVCDYPAVGDVEKGVSFDGGAKVGTFKVPAENKVEQGEGYGANDVEFTGTLLAVSFALPLVGVLSEKFTMTGTITRII